MLGFVPLFITLMISPGLAQVDQVEPCSSCKSSTNPASLKRTDPPDELRLRLLAQNPGRHGGIPIAYFAEPTRVTCGAIHYNFEPKTLKPGQSMYFSVPEAYRTRALTFVVLGHRQDPAAHPGFRSGMTDPRPGLSSVQIHTTDFEEPDQWRYWGGPSSGEHGSKFAEVDRSFEIENLYEWHKMGHASVVRRTKSRNDLHADAFRMVSTGLDPVIVREVSLKFRTEPATEFMNRVFSPGTEIGDPETEKNRRYGGGQAFGGKYPGALSLKEHRARGANLPPGWHAEQDGVHIPLPPGRTVTDIEVACGDSRPDGVINEDRGIGSKGSAKLSMGIIRKDESADWFMKRENVPPEGVLRSGPTDCGFTTREGDELVLRSDNDITYLMALRIGLRSSP